MDLVVQGVPRNTTLGDYCAFVLLLSDLCRSERIEGRWRKDLHSWYLYRQSFYGIIDYLYPSVRCMASEFALAEFRRSESLTDIRTLRWKDQPQFDQGRLAGTFHFEHVFTGDMFRQQVELISHRDNRTLHLTDIVRQNYCVAWILKSENSYLGRGDRGNSLSSALEYYKNCNINLVEQDG